MTINFPKFPNNQRDKNRPIGPNMTVGSPLDDTSVEGELPTGDNPAHNRTYQDMLTQTAQLQSDTLTEAQRTLLKKRLKSQTRPTQKTKTLPLMPLLVGLILLASGGVLGYMYQAYTQPPMPVSVSAPVATPATSQATATMPASGVAGNTVPVATPPTTAPTTTAPAVPISDKPAVATANSSANPTPATKPPSSDATPMPSPTNAEGSQSNTNPNGNNNVTGNTTTSPPTPKSMPSEAVMPANPKPTSPPVTAPEANATTHPRPSGSPTKNTKSYEDFVKSSENTVFIEPPNHK